MEKAEGESTCRTSSGSIVSSDEDLMMNVFSWLPVKVLSRFRCVCKQWSMLISDPYFVSTHQGRATQDLNITKLICMVDQDGLIRVRSIEEKEERKITHDLIRPNYPNRFPWKYRYAKIVGRTCNGLICLEDCRLTLVCNPATRNTVVIPRGKERRYSYLQGLGFCSSSNEFKVVRLYRRSKDYGCELFTVFQRGVHPLQYLRSWRHVGNFPYHIYYPSERIMCHVKGRVYWIIEPLASSFSDIILSLDLELEKFKIVSCPEHWPEDVRYDEHVNLTELGGELSIVLRTLESWQIWVLKDYTNSIWSKEYQIKKNISDCPSLYDVKVAGIRRGRLLLIINFITLCYYDPRNNSLEVVIREIYPSSFPWRVDTYDESPVIPF
ncbi:hypothetical protein NE237_007914 [Protea cynaroides]|uniref:F-box domain-containing protein n=1 Tax=Protea cynaroides TaxID=273540 RepID=A0A9Q0QWK7_9MAGN|nr:hypothetical protein NE237_007914 [Protea cynaroides]